MATLVLRNSLTLKYKGMTLRRGVPIEVQDTDDYHALLALGCRNPNQDLTDVHPTQLKLAPAGTEVPVIRTGGLGDVLMVLPGLRDLAARFPRLRFLFVTHQTFFPLLRDVDFVHRTATVESIQGKWKWVIDLRGLVERHGKEREYRVDSFSRYMNRAPATSSDYPLRVRDEDIARGVGITKGGASPLLVLGVGSISQNGMRDWPAAYNDRLVQLASRAGWRVAIVDPKPRQLSPTMETARVLNLTGRLSIPDLIAVLAVADVVVAPDTGLLHLSEALDRPTVGYFTTVPPEARAARYSHTRALYAGVPCAPCYHAPTCGLSPGETKCALGVAPERVWQEIEWIATQDPPYHFRAPIASPVAELRRQEVRTELLSIGGP